jgi:hypothetical protein
MNAIVAFKDPPTLICATTTAVNTAHSKDEPGHGNAVGTYNPV